MAGAAWNQTQVLAYANPLPRETGLIFLAPELLLIIAFPFLSEMQRVVKLMEEIHGRPKSTWKSTQYH